MAKHEAMGPYLAVFNGHINNAHNRAMALMNLVVPDDAERVRTAIKGGVMSIFDRKPNDATKFYVAVVTAYVNEDLVG